MRRKLIGFGRGWFIGMMSPSPTMALEARKGRSVSVRSGM